MAYYISKEELGRMDREGELDISDKSWVDLEIKVKEFSEREKRHRAREERKEEQERLKEEIERKKEEKRQENLDLEMRKKEASERELRKQFAEVEKKANKQRLLDLARKKREALERKQKRLDAESREKMRLEADDRERKRLEADDDRGRKRLEAEDREMKLLEAEYRGKMRLEAAEDGDRMRLGAERIERIRLRRLQAEEREKRTRGADEIQHTGVEAEYEEIRGVDDEVEAREHRRVESEEDELRRLQYEEDRLDALKRQRINMEEELENSNEYEINASYIQSDSGDECGDTVEGPFDTSTDIDDDNEPIKSPDVLDREIVWLDQKLQELKDSVKKTHRYSRPKPIMKENRDDYSFTSQTRPKQTMKEEEDYFLPKSQMPKQIKKQNADSHEKKRESDNSKLRSLERPVKEPYKSSNDDLERKLRDKVERLQKKDKDMSLMIEDMKAKTEKEMQKKKEQKLREERIRKLKEQEQSLFESLGEKESVLSELEISYRDEIDKDQRERNIKKDQADKHKRQEIKRKQETKDRNKRHEKDHADKRKEQDSKKEHENKDLPKKQVKEERKIEDHSSSLLYRKPTIPKLTEDTFEEWKTEVEVVMNSNLYHADIVRQGVRNSLSGSTRKVLLNMDPGASTKDLVKKLENVYGNIRTGESVLAEFYQTRQKEKENVAEWGIRVESILNTAIKKGQVKREQADEMLRNRFWRHLKSDQLKNATRVCYETADNFEELRKKVRIEENEMQTAKEGEKELEKQVTSQQRSDKDEQLTLMKSLLERMEKLEAKISNPPKQSEGNKNEDQSRETDRNPVRDDRNPGRDEGQREGNWNNRGYGNNRGNNNYRGRWNNRSGYRYGGYRGNYNSHFDRNRSVEQKESEGQGYKQETVQESKVDQKDVTENKGLN